MKLFKIVLLFVLITGCANTEDVDDSDVESDIASSQSETTEESTESEDGEVAETAPAPTPAPYSGKGPYEARGEAATLLYNIASSALKKADSTLSYNVKCTYVIKPLSIKACMVKTGFLPSDAKAKIGKLLLEAKNLPRKKSGKNEAVVVSKYTCTKGKSAADTVCKLDKG